MTEVKQRRPPMRWRKAKYDGLGTNMDRTRWYRENGRDIELWCGSIHCATVKPNGTYQVRVGHDRRVFSLERRDIDQAKAAAKAVVLDALEKGPSSLD